MAYVTIATLDNSRGASLINYSIAHSKRDGSVICRIHTLNLIGPQTSKNDRHGESPNVMSAGGDGHKTAFSGLQNIFELNVQLP